MDATELGVMRDTRATSTVGEVRYEEEGRRLTVAVAADLSRDGTLADVLTDILATAPTERAATQEIFGVSERVGLGVHVERYGDDDVLVLTPTPTGEYG